MKYIVIAALLGLLTEQTQATEINRYYQTRHPVYVQESESESESESDSSDEADVQLSDKPEKEEPYHHWMDGFGGYHTYIRDIPDRFEEESDDTLMRSLYKNYATEGRKNDLPTGHFWVTKENAMRASNEVVQTHLKLSDGDAKSYLKENFDDLWAKYDVNEEG